MTKEIIDYICENKDSDWFKFDMTFKQYQEFKQCKEKVVEIIFNVLGDIEYGIKYNNLSEKFILSINKMGK